MKHDVSYNLFTAKDVARLLGINANMLFHWVQTKGLLKPSVRGLGRGKKNYFSLEDLATLSLIKILCGYKMDLWQIKSIIAEIANPNPTIIFQVEIEEPGPGMVLYGDGLRYPYDEIGPINVWQIYKKGKELFEKNGLLLYTHGTFDGKISPSGIGIGGETKFISMARVWGEGPTYISLLMIDLLEVIKEIEKRTGLTI